MKRVILSFFIFLSPFPLFVRIVCIIEIDSDKLFFYHVCHCVYVTLTVLNVMRCVNERKRIEFAEWKWIYCWIRYDRGAFVGEAKSEAKSEANANQNVLTIKIRRLGNFAVFRVPQHFLYYSFVGIIHFNMKHLNSDTTA